MQTISHVIDPDHIGYLIDYEQFPGKAFVTCRECAWKVIHARKGGSWSKLYRVNVGSYWQSCHACGKVIEQGQGCGKEGCEIGSHFHTHWCELFPKKGS